MPSLFLTGISWSFTQTTQQQKWLHELHILLCAYTVDTVEKNTFLTLTKIKIPLIRSFPCNYDLKPTGAYCKLNRVVKLQNLKHII